MCADAADLALLLLHLCLRERSTHLIQLTAYTLILLQFSMQTISRKMVKLNLILLSLCSALDVLWFILYTWKLWYLPWAYDFPFMASNYLKFTIVIMVFCFCLRATLFYYYLSQYHIE